MQIKMKIESIVVVAAAVSFLMCLTVGLRGLKDRKV
jgi:hypothetical protein